MKQYARRFLFLAVTIYCLAALPSVLLLSQSEFYRFQTWQELSRKAAHFIPTKFFFCGDSITASGRNWGWVLGVNPLSTLNQGVSGALIHQVKAQVDKAVEQSPRVVSIMAGTNDVHRPDFNPARAERDFSEIFEIISSRPEILFVLTSVPETRGGSHAAAIGSLNGFLLRESSSYPNARFLDLNQAMRESEKDRASFYDDDVHLNAAGLELWGSLLREHFQR